MALRLQRRSFFEKALFLLVLFRDISIKGRGDAWILWSRCFQVEPQSGLADSFGRRGAESSDGHLALLEFREGVQQALDTAGAEKHEHVLVKRLATHEVVGHSAIHHTLGMTEFLLVQQILNLVIMDITQGYEEAFVLVLEHGWQQVIDFPGGTVENLTLAILNILLNVERYLLCYAKVLHVVTYDEAQILSKLEEVVDGVPRCEDDGAEVGKRNLLSSKFPGRKSFDLDERAKDELYAVAGSEIVVRRLFRRGLRL